MLPASVDLVHVLPPPCGGIPTHLKRMHERLQGLGVECRSYLHPRWHSSSDPRPAGIEMMPQSTWKFPFTWKWLARFGLAQAKAITHFHDGFEWSSVVYAMRRMKRPTVMTIHSITSREVLKECSLYDRMAAKWIVRDPGIRWIAVSEEAKAELAALGVLPGRISVIPAYLPPAVNKTAARLPDRLEAFAAQHQPLLAAYGFMLLRDAARRDAYGFDMCCQAVKRLRQTHPAIGLVLLIPRFHPLVDAESLRGLIAKLRLTDRILLWTEPLVEAWPLWSKSSVYLRPSTIDGDAVAVREALYVGTPVVASDVVARPKGVLLHKNRDLEDFLRVIRQALATGKQAAAIHDPGEAFFENILQVYHSTLGDLRWNRQPNQRWLRDTHHGAKPTTTPAT